MAWSLSKLPPEGHEDVGPFVLSLFRESEAEKERLGLPSRWLENHRLYRGGAVQGKSKYGITANIIFANIQRTVANLTAKNPSAEVVSQDWRPKVNAETGEAEQDDTDTVMTQHLKGWWSDTEQIQSLVDSALNQEIYGLTAEKAVYDLKTRKGDTVIIDPFALVVCPGNWTDLSSQTPYVGHAYHERSDRIKDLYDVEAGSPTGTTLGEEREDNRPTMTGNYPGSIPSGSHVVTNYKATPKSEDALVIELWVRDLTEAEHEEVDEETGETVKVKGLKYPGGIRMITVTDTGKVLEDVPNPNVNPALWENPQTRKAVEQTYLFSHFPFWYANSYRDPASLWGFAAAEQVGGMAEQIGGLLSRMHEYLARVMKPTLILPKDCGVTINQVNNNPGLVLQPTSAAVAAGIKYLEIPSLPADTVRLYNMLLTMFDRVYQIEDADRGDTPNRIVAASAIVALQERNAVLMKHKIRAIDYLIRQRGRAAISYLQNFGTVREVVKIDDNSVAEVLGIDLLGRKFAYVVESGSTIPQTQLQTKEIAFDLYKLGAIDKRALLEVQQFPGWRQIVERMTESGDQLEQAAQVFVQAGVPVEHIQQMLAFARQPQGGPGDTTSPEKTVMNMQTQGAM